MAPPGSEGSSDYEDLDLSDVDDQLPHNLPATPPPQSQLSAPSQPSSQQQPPPSPSPALSVSPSRPRRPSSMAERMSVARAAARRQRVSNNPPPSPSPTAASPAPAVVVFRKPPAPRKTPSARPPPPRPSRDALPADSDSASDHDGNDKDDDDYINRDGEQEEHGDDYVEPNQPTVRIAVRGRPRKSPPAAKRSNPLANGQQPSKKLPVASKESPISASRTVKAAKAAAAATARKTAASAAVVLSPTLVDDAPLVSRKRARKQPQPTSDGEETSDDDQPAKRVRKSPSKALAAARSRAAATGKHAQEDEDDEATQKPDSDVDMDDSQALRLSSQDTAKPKRTRHPALTQTQPAARKLSTSRLVPQVSDSDEGSDDAPSPAELIRAELSRKARELNLKKAEEALKAKKKLSEEPKTPNAEIEATPLSTPRKAKIRTATTKVSVTRADGDEEPIAAPKSKATKSPKKSVAKPAEAPEENESDDIPLKTSKAPKRASTARAKTAKSKIIQPLPANSDAEPSDGEHEQRIAEKKRAKTTKKLVPARTAAMDSAAQEEADVVTNVLEGSAVAPPDSDVGTHPMDDDGDVPLKKTRKKPAKEPKESVTEAKAKPKKTTSTAGDAVTKKRARTKKDNAAADQPGNSEEVALAVEGAAAAEPKKRGRPKKKVAAPVDESPSTNEIRDVPTSAEAKKTAKGKSTAASKKPSVGKEPTMGAVVEGEPSASPGRDDLKTVGTKKTKTTVSKARPGKTTAISDVLEAFPLAEQGGTDVGDTTKPEQQSKLGDLDIEMSNEPAGGAKEITTSDPASTEEPDGIQGKDHFEDGKSAARQSLEPIRPAGTPKIVGNEKDLEQNEGQTTEAEHSTRKRSSSKLAETSKPSKSTTRKQKPKTSNKAVSEPVKKASVPIKAKEGNEDGMDVDTNGDGDGAADLPNTSTENAGDEQRKSASSLPATDEVHRLKDNVPDAPEVIATKLLNRRASMPASLGTAHRGPYNHWSEHARSFFRDVEHDMRRSTEWLNNRMDKFLRDGQEDQMQWQHSLGTLNPTKGGFRDARMSRPGSVFDTRIRSLTQELEAQQLDVMEKYTKEVARVIREETCARFSATLEEVFDKAQAQFAIPEGTENATTPDGHSSAAPSHGLSNRLSNGRLSLGIGGTTATEGLSTKVVPSGASDSNGANDMKGESNRASVGRGSKRAAQNKLAEGEMRNGIKRMMNITDVRVYVGQSFAGLGLNCARSQAILKMCNTEGGTSFRKMYELTPFSESMLRTRVANLLHMKFLIQDSVEVDAGPAVAMYSVAPEIRQYGYDE